MKQCPNCQTTYTDDSLQFCLADGAPLNFAGGDAPTVEMSLGNQNAPARVNLPPDSAPTIFAAPPVNGQAVSTNQPSKNSLGLVFAGLFGILLLLFGGTAAAYFLLPGLIASQNSPVNSPSPSPTGAPKTSPTAPAADDETERLKKEMANLKKQLENQKNQKNDSTAPPFSPPSGSRTARANSPRDGFLALRSEPDSETGYRLAKIPHGATLTVLGCPKPSNVGKMPGRWCQVIYNGEAGWAFDAFMTF